VKSVLLNYPSIIVILPGDKSREAKGIPMVQKAEYDLPSKKTVVTMAADRNWKPQDRKRAMTALRKAFLHVAGKVLTMEHFRAGVEISINKLIQRK